MNNRETFEAWMKTHGGLDLTMHDAMDNEKLPFPCTYYSYTTEIAWRAFANKKEPAQASQAQQPTAYRVIASANGEVVRDSLEFTRMSEIDEKVVRKSYDLEIVPLYAAMQPQAQQPEITTKDIDAAFLKECADENGHCVLKNDVTFAIGYKTGYQTCLASHVQQSESQWISVEERLPDCDCFVDVFVRSRSNLAYGTRFTEFRFINGMFDVSSLPSACYVSHWMPLPPAPEGE